MILYNFAYQGFVFVLIGISMILGFALIFDSMIITFIGFGFMILGFVSIFYFAYKMNKEAEKESE